jgi:hypothetical protein
LSNSIIYQAIENNCFNSIQLVYISPLVAHA